MPFTSYCRPLRLNIPIVVSRPFAKDQSIKAYLRNVFRGESLRTERHIAEGGVASDPWYIVISLRKVTHSNMSFVYTFMSNNIL